MVYVEVLYSDLSRQHVPLEEIGGLPKDNVLFILVRTDQREGKLKNITSCSGFDNYALLQKRNNSTDWLMLFGWDDDDFTWRTERQGREMVDAPIGTMHVIFRGAHVSPEVWAEAKVIIDKEM